MGAVDMVGHPVQDDAQIGLGGADQRAQGGHAPEPRLHPVVVGDVVAVVAGGALDGRQPEGRGAQAAEVVQALDHSAQVAAAEHRPFRVPLAPAGARAAEAVHQDLVEHRFAPPRPGLHGGYREAFLR